MSIRIEGERPTDCSRELRALREELACLIKGLPAVESMVVRLERAALDDSRHARIYDKLDAARKLLDAHQRAIAETEHS
jgi:hypothetical protein